MLKEKNARQRGKLSLSKYFKEFSGGDRVAIIKEHGQAPKFPDRIHGLSGIIEGKRGKSYLVKVREGKTEKIHIIRPVHLKELR